MPNASSTRSNCTLRSLCPCSPETFPTSNSAATMANMAELLILNVADANGGRRCRIEFCRSRSGTSGLFDPEIGHVRSTPSAASSGHFRVPYSSPAKSPPSDCQTVMQVPPKSAQNGIAVSIVNDTELLLDLTLRKAFEGTCEKALRQLTDSESRSLLVRHDETRMIRPQPNGKETTGGNILNLLVGRSHGYLDKVCLHRRGKLG